MVHGGHGIVGDDKEPRRFWRIWSLQLAKHLMATVLIDGLRNALALLRAQPMLHIGDTMSNKEFEIAVKFRLGLAVIPNVPEACICEPALTLKETIG